MLFMSNSERRGILPTFRDNHTGNVPKQIVKVYIHDLSIYFSFHDLFVFSNTSKLYIEGQSLFYHEQARYFAFRAFCLF